MKAILSLPRLSPALLSTIAAGLLSLLLVAVTPASGGSSISIAIVSPGSNATVTGSVSWLANVSGTAKTVDFYIDGVLRWTEQRAPYQYHLDNTNGTLDTTKLANGTHELKVVANAPNRSTALAGILVSVSNGVPPTAATATPANGAVVSGTVTWDATASGVVTRVVFLVDGAQKWVENSVPYRYNSDGNFPTTTLPDGTHTLGLRAEGPGGSSTSSISVTVANRQTSTSPTTGTAPTNTAPPVASGTAIVGQVLSATLGTWNGTAPLSYAGTWQRCAGGSCSAIAGSASSSYKLTSADIGATVRRAVTATNSAGSATARSAQTATVEATSSATVPVNTVLPVISGTAAVGQTISATTGTWTGTAPIAFFRSWERCLDGTCSPIAGAAAATYTLVGADAGATIRHAVTAFNDVGADVAVSDRSAVVEAAAATAVGTALPARMAESTGTSYYVDGSRGSDSNPGTLSLPWRTINKALATVPLSGSIINVRAGTYVGMHQLVNRYGSRLNPITLQPYQGEKVVLTAPAGAQLHAFLVSKGGGLRLRGFEVTAPSALDGIKVENGKDVEIVGNEIHHTGRQGILVAGSGTTAPTGSSNVQIWSNRFHDNGGYWAAGDHSVYWGAVSSNSDGVDHTTYGGVIANNLFYNQPYGFQLQIGSQASGLIVTNNTFYRAAGPSPAGGAIVLYTETQTAAYVTRSVLVVNNLITHAANRGVYGSGGGGLMSTNVVRNNLAYGNATGDFLSYYGSTSNVLFQLGANFTGQSPLFVNASGLDFRLQAGSPAIGKSDPAYTPPADFAGRGRSGPPDLGALEY